MLATILEAISILCTDKAITDTLWMPGGHITVVESLSRIAAELGATDEQIEAVTAMRDRLA